MVASTINHSGRQQVTSQWQLNLNHISNAAEHRNNSRLENKKMAA
jgi:hypothetical protein